ncbi:MAG: hypothetical protein ACTS27_08085 [Phycisphaerales bacterium]
MGRLIGLALAATHLIEAEGRSARRGATRVVTRAITLAGFGIIFLFGLGFVMFGLYLALVPEVGRAGAALITGLATMAIAGLAAWISAEKTR